MICDRCGWLRESGCTCRPGMGAKRRAELEAEAERARRWRMRLALAAARRAAEREAS